MTGMENVLAAHVATTHNIGGNTDGGHQSRRCQCGSEVTAYYSEMADDADDLRLYLNAKFAAHVAEALTAAGFGNLHDAWAEGVATALNHAIQNDDGITLRLEHLDGRPWTNPYPKVSLPSARDQIEAGGGVLVSRLTLPWTAAE